MTAQTTARPQPRGALRLRLQADADLLDAALPGDEEHIFRALEPGTTAILVSEHT